MMRKLTKVMIVNLNPHQLTLNTFTYVTHYSPIAKNNFQDFLKNKWNNLKKKVFTKYLCLI